MTQPKDRPRERGNSVKRANTPLEIDNSQSSQQVGTEKAFPKYSDAELKSLLADVRKFDEASFISVAHSDAVKD
ncbi:hypothetical protein PQR21_37955 [Paraburkholderia nemoris]|uniref:hypothetical protein n=1 Tax=Paraburkholderia nemoris TaxID=2793076 RepID=UPI0038BC0344